ncbi:MULTISPECIES: acetyltransferase [Thiorhodovibrio]|uniref:acetyltransferase n=1 Tax=Thiorhodovibrio TaxID=61593 RepID=UPI0019115D03|nr:MULTISPECIES: acetyltransferase [Thiorhodovibrio]MBK5968517.1 acetyltransferase [Thiorhodovibrio winogradskyi]WPL13432.1 hypothetical protein Thiosp_03233 [Thiorhodovibrio litoralis]
MFVKDAPSDKLVEVLSLRDLFNPLHPQVIGRFHVGEEAQDPEKFNKETLCFLSGEPFPRCWTDPHYRDAEVERVSQATSV